MLRQSTSGAALGGVKVVRVCCLRLKQLRSYPQQLVVRVNVAVAPGPVLAQVALGWEVNRDSLREGDRGHEDDRVVRLQLPGDVERELDDDRRSRAAFAGYRFNLRGGRRMRRSGTQPGVCCSRSV